MKKGQMDMLHLPDSDGRAGTARSCQHMRGKPEAALPG